MPTLRRNAAMMSSTKKTWQPRETDAIRQPLVSREIRANSNQMSNRGNQTMEVMHAIAPPVSQPISFCVFVAVIDTACSEIHGDSSSSSRSKTKERYECILHNML